MLPSLQQRAASSPETESRCPCHARSDPSRPALPPSYPDACSLAWPFPGRRLRELNQTGDLGALRGDCAQNLCIGADEGHETHEAKIDPFAAVF